MIIQPLISIIVPVYKAEKYLECCVKCVLAQTYNNWELLLVDNGSPDKCHELCDVFAKQDSRIKAFHLTENRGVSSGRNKGIEEALGEYITFLDTDDSLHPSFLEEMLMLCIDNNADMAQCSHIRGSDYHFPEKKKETVRVYDNHTVFISETTNIVVWGKLYHRNVAKGVSFPYGIFYEDDHTTWKYYYRSKRIAVTDRPLYYYFFNQNSTMVQLYKKPSLSYFEAYENRIAFFKEKGLQDLVDCSHLQLCKSMVLIYKHPLLETEQKTIIRNRFRESWKVIRSSKYIKGKYKLLFLFFDHMPYWTSLMANKLR